MGNAVRVVSGYAGANHREYNASVSYYLKLAGCFCRWVFADGVSVEYRIEGLESCL